MQHKSQRKSLTAQQQGQWCSTAVNNYPRGQYEFREADVLRAAECQDVKHTCNSRVSLLSL
jgi:hypothetical protein